MENEHSVGYGIAINGGDNSGNFSVGDNPNQIQYSSDRATDSHIHDTMRMVGALLAQRSPDVADEPGAQSALEELADELGDGAAPSRPDRVRIALTKLRDAIGGASRFLLPLAELATAIDKLLQGKP